MVQIKSDYRCPFCNQPLKIKTTQLASPIILPTLEGDELVISSEDIFEVDFLTCQKDDYQNFIVHAVARTVTEPS